MADFMVASFVGSDDLIKRLQDYSVEFRQDALVDALTEAAEPMRQAMAAHAPKGPDAPHVADHIVISKLSKMPDGTRIANDTGQAAVGIGPSKSYAYALPLELGFRHYPDEKPIIARPFVRPAFDQGQDAALTTIGRRLWDLVTGRNQRSATSSLL